MLQVPWGWPERAFFTVPPGISISHSLIPGAGLGAFSWTFIKPYTWLGEYEGQPSHGDTDSLYVWQVGIFIFHRFFVCVFFVFHFAYLQLWSTI